MALQTNYRVGQSAGIPGMQADMSEWDASSKTATATINFGAPVQRSGGDGCSPLASGGEYIGIARARHQITGNGDVFVQGDTLPVVNEGNWWGLADAAIAAGAGLNWNTATQRWTTATTSGTIIAVPQAEAETAAGGAGSIFIVRLRRIPS